MGNSEVLPRAFAELSLRTMFTHHQDIVTAMSECPLGPFIRKIGLLATTLPLGSLFCEAARSFNSSIYSAILNPPWVFPVQRRASYTLQCSSQFWRKIGHQAAFSLTSVEDASPGL